MMGMAAAVERLERAIELHEPVLLYGDYDVDGTTAVVLLKTAMRCWAARRASTCLIGCAKATDCNRVCLKLRTLKGCAL